MPPGKLLTVRTFRETPVPPNPFWPLSLAICPPQKGTVLAGMARNSHSSLRLFSSVSHSRTYFSFLSCSRTIISARNSGIKKRRRKGGQIWDEERLFVGYTFFSFYLSLAVKKRPPKRKLFSAGAHKSFASFDRTWDFSNVSRYTSFFIILLCGHVVMMIINLLQHCEEMKDR